MDEFLTPFSNPTTTIATTASWVSHSQQIMDHPQNVLFSSNNESHHFNAITPSPPMLCVPPPYIVPYDQNLGQPFMHMNQPLGGYPMYSTSVEQSNGIIPTYEPHQGLLQSREENMMINEALMAKFARYRRKQARQRIRSSSNLGVPSIPEGTIRAQPHVTHVFYAPDGKMLTQFLTKTLRNSDVGNVGRIIIPKRGAEEMLPTLCNKKGTNILVQDVYSDLKWSFKYKYWSNNKSHRMYILENTGKLNLTFYFLSIIALVLTRF
ncbi:putative transcription factor B3-Domain family [Lupinus albus]|uniref:Putative transcription factor B3-Domain family n=1 Tax=Lupinus albus TaxID=3870 RepID=A0A6A4Q136_LUPAL|nr:putative transcription factor B3-Domain family [Lupinus albus]